MKEYNFQHFSLSHATKFARFAHYWVRLLLVFGLIFGASQVFANSGDKTKRSCPEKWFKPLHSSFPILDTHKSKTPAGILKAIQRATDKDHPYFNEDYFWGALSHLSSLPIDDYERTYEQSLVLDDFVPVHEYTEAPGVRHLSNESFRDHKDATICCSEAEKLFWNTYLRYYQTLPSENTKESHGNFIAVVLKGVGIVGVHKHFGEATFLGLTNIVDPVTKRPMILKGAIYRIPIAFRINHFEKYAGEKDKLLYVELTELPLISRRFIIPGSENFLNDDLLFPEDDAAAQTLLKSAGNDRRLLLRARWMAYLELLENARFNLNLELLAQEEREASGF